MNSLNKPFKNHDAMFDNGVVAMTYFLIISLTFTTVSVSWFLLNIYGVSVSPISLGNFNGGQDYNFKVISTTTNNVLIYNGNWDFSSGIGRTASNDNSFIIFNDVISNTNSHFTTEYNINNTYQSDYGIILEYFSEGYSEILTKSDGYYYHSYYTVFGYPVETEKFFPYPDANKIQYANIKVDYNPVMINDNSVEYTVNGITVVTMTYPELTGVHTTLNKKYYGGVHAESAGLTLESFSSTSDKTENGWDALINRAIQFVVTLLTILVWNVDPTYLPWELNIMFIKTQEFGLLACAMAYARG